MNARIRIMPVDAPTKRGDVFRAGDAELKGDLPIYMEDDQTLRGMVGGAHKVWIENGWVLAEVRILDTRLTPPADRVLYVVPNVIGKRGEDARIRPWSITSLCLTIYPPAWDTKPLGLLVAQ